MSWCPFCGSNNSEDSKWCKNCGRSLIFGKDDWPESTVDKGKSVSSTGLVGRMGKTNYVAEEKKTETGDMHIGHVSGPGLMGSMGTTAYNSSPEKTGAEGAGSGESPFNLHGSMGGRAYRPGKPEKTGPSEEIKSKFYGHMGEKTYSAGSAETTGGASGSPAGGDAAYYGYREKESYGGGRRMDGPPAAGGHKPPPPNPAKWIAAACLLLAVIIGIAAFALRGKKEPPVSLPEPSSPADPVNYYVPVDENNVWEEDGVQFVPNQMVVVVKNGVSEQEARTLFSAYDLSVVGYIELMDTYQVQLNEQMPLSELQQLANDLAADSRVETASVDMVWESETGGFPSDPWSENSSAVAQWDNMNGNNWGVKAINAPYCWENYDLGVVKVGIIDSMFYPSHVDLTAQFSECHYNAIFNTYVPKDQYDSAKEHGTHVAGIIGATHNNQCGLSGVLENGSIYAYAMWGFDGNMDVLSAIAELSNSGVKVVNYSIGYIKEITLKAQNGNKDTINYYYEEASAIKAAALSRLLQNGNDFLFVTSAGNSAVDARWGSDFAYINSPEIKSRILVVGAAGNDNGYYSLASFSNYGERLDITAPGVDIFSTLPYDQYDSWNGTSMAAPHVTGVCASVWAAAPELTGAQVKEIVTSTADIPVTGNCPNMVNMKAAMGAVAPVAKADKPKPAQKSEAERQEALLAYAELLNDGILLNENEYGLRTVNVTHYYLFDMDGDGIEEMIAYASPIYAEWSFELYAYKNGQVIKIADSVNTCDISQWSNCQIIIRISDGVLNAYAGKATAAYSGESDNYLYYDGSSVMNYRSASSVPETWVENEFLLVRTDENYGIAIGSDDDVLRKIYLENHPAQTPVYNDVEDGEYNGNIVSIQDEGDGWVVDIDVTTYDLYSNSFVRGLKAGDSVTVAGTSYQVLSKGETVVDLGGIFLGKRQDGYWIACDPAGGAITYSIGTQRFYVSGSATFVDNSMLENITVSSPWDVLNGWDVRFILSNHQIIYMESTFHP